MRIEHGKQGQGDAGFRRSCHNAMADLAGIVVGLSVGSVVEVMEFRHGREAAFHHFDERHGGDGLHVLGCEPTHEGIHGFAPCPEMVVLVAATLCQAREASLKGVAVHIADTRKRNAQIRRDAGLGIRIGLDRGEAAALDRHRDPIGPAARQQRTVEKQLVHHPLRLDSSTLNGSRPTGHGFGWIQSAGPART